MTKAQLARLREAVRQCVQELHDRRQGTTRGLVETVRERYPDLVEEAAEQLLAEAIANMSRRIMKSDARAAKSEQFILPALIAHLRLPATISVPHDDGDDDEVVWTPLEHASFAELDIHLAMLARSIAADTRRFKALTELREFLAPYMADTPDAEPIGAVLARLAAAERGAA